MNHARLQAAVGNSVRRLMRSSGLLMTAIIVSSAGGCTWMSSGQNSQGVRLFEQGNFDAAAQNFRKAIQTDPKNPDGYYNLAAYYHRQGKTMQRPVDLAQAENYYRQCLDFNPNHFDCRRGLAVLMVEEGRSEEAFKMLEDWSTQNPTMAEPKIELARMFEEFGDKEAAKQHLTSALSVAPNDPRALAALGKLREEQGDYGQALSNYQRSLAAYRYQPQLAERVAALQSAGVNSTTVAAGGTQVVTTVR